MVDLSFEEIIEKVIIEKKIPRWKLLELIEKKKKELGGLITDRSAAMLVARELGLNFFNKFVSEGKIDINKLKPGMRNVTLIGKVLHIFPIREFTIDNRKNEVASLILGDETGEIRVVFWNSNHIKLIRDGEIKRNDLLRIIGADVRENRSGNVEVHVGSRGKIVINPEDIDSKKIPKVSAKRLKIKDLHANMYNIILSGIIKKKSNLTSFKRGGRQGKFLSAILGDETGEIRVVFWNEKAEEVEKLNEGSIVELEGAHTRPGRIESLEVHVGPESTIRILQPEDVDEKILTSTSASKLQFTSIKNLTSGIKTPYVNVKGIVSRIESLREFIRGDGSIGKRLVFTVSDENGNAVRVVAWDDEAEQLGNISEGDVIQILHGHVKKKVSGNLEIHISKLSTTQIIEKRNLVPPVQIQRPIHTTDFRRVKLKDINENERVEIRASVVYLFDRPLLYNACPDCFKKVELRDDKWFCSDCSKEVNNPAQRLTLTCIIDDGSDTIVAKCWDDVAAKLLDLKVRLDQITRDELLPRLSEIIGKDFIFRGTITYNDVSGRFELNVIDVEQVDPITEAEKLIDEVKKIL